MKEKTYLDRNWETTNDEYYVDLIKGLVYLEEIYPEYQIKGMPLPSYSKDLDIEDCYFDELGDLYVPNVYNEIGNGRDDVYPEEYRLLFTKEFLAQQYADFKKERVQVQRTKVL